MKTSEETNRPGRKKRLAWRMAGRLGAGAGFTLIELLVSAAVMSFILAAAYVCFSSGIASQNLVEERVEMAQQARVALGIITADLRCAGPLSKDVEFLGMDRMLGEVEADNLDFGTYHYGPRRAGEGDFCEVSYFLVREPGSGLHSLWRRRQPGISADPLSGGERTEIARGLRGLRFEYYDGLDWYNDWGDAGGRGLAETSWRRRPNLKGMPEAVRITMWLDAVVPAGRGERGSAARGEPAVMYQTVARLELAPLTWTDSASTGTGEDEGESAESAMPVAPAGGRGQ